MNHAIYEDRKISVYCTECGHCETFRGSKKKYNAIVGRRDLIQNILPNIKPSVREMFLSGWCGCCFDLKVMHFPKLAIEELNQMMKDNFSKWIPEGCSIGCNDDVIEFLSAMEEYDGPDLKEMKKRLTKFRKKIEEIADRIDEGFYE